MNATGRSLGDCRCHGVCLDCREEDRPPSAITSERPPSGNRLLDALPQDQQEWLHRHLRAVDLPAGKMLHEAGDGLWAHYFPLDGAISLVAVFPDGQVVGMATAGREGMVAADAILGGDRAVGRYVVQVPGTALALDHEALDRLAQELPAFGERLRRHAQAFHAQVLQSVACNAIHSVPQRAARWLLMGHDRAGTDSFALTQEALARMLGVTRPTMTVVARMLQQAGLIRATRSVVTVTDRTGLEEAACACYEIVRRHYERLGLALGRDAPPR